MTATLTSLVGRTIVAARYVEIDQCGAAGWVRDEHDELDRGLELDLDDGSTCSITWDDSDGHDTLAVLPGPLPRPVGVVDHDVTARWADLAPRRIARVDTRQGTGLDAILLTGDDGRVAVATLQWGDTVIVRFTATGAQDAGFPADA